MFQGRKEGRKKERKEGRKEGVMCCCPRHKIKIKKRPPTEG